DAAQPAREPLALLGQQVALGQDEEDRQARHLAVAAALLLVAAQELAERRQHALGRLRLDARLGQDEQRVGLKDIFRQRVGQRVERRLLLEQLQDFPAVAVDQLDVDAAVFRLEAQWVADGFAVVGGTG